MLEYDQYAELMVKTLENKLEILQIRNYQMLDHGMGNPDLYDKWLKEEMELVEEIHSWKMGYCPFEPK